MSRRDAHRFRVEAVRPAGLRTWYLWRRQGPGAPKGRTYVVDIRRVQTEAGTRLKLEPGMELEVTLEEGSDTRIALAVSVAMASPARV
jgi:hypothetical protein